MTMTDVGMDQKMIPDAVMDQSIVVMDQKWTHVTHEGETGLIWIDDVGLISTVGMVQIWTYDEMHHVIV